MFRNKMFNSTAMCKVRDFVKQTGLININIRCTENKTTSLSKQIVCDVGFWVWIVNMEGRFPSTAKSGGVYQGLPTEILAREHRPPGRAGEGKAVVHWKTACPKQTFLFPVALWQVNSFFTVMYNINKNNSKVFLSLSPECISRVNNSMSDRCHITHTPHCSVYLQTSETVKRPRDSLVYARLVEAENLEAYVQIFRLDESP